MAMTRQQIFNTAYHGLAAQGFQRSMRENGFGCAYRGADGRRCALGYLIPDAVYDPEWDSDHKSMSAYMLSSENITNEICEGNQRFLIDLQTVHDDSLTPQTMKRELGAFAARHNLTVPELPDFKVDAAERELVAAE